MKLDKTTVLVLGGAFPGGFRNTPLLSTTNFDEYDVILCQTQNMLQQIKRDNAYIDEVHFSYMKERLDALTKWVESGRTLILWAPYPLSFQADNGTGVTRYSLGSFAPLDEVEMIISAGQRITTCGNDPVSDALAPFVGKLNYAVVLEGKDLIPVLRVDTRSSNKQSTIVGGYRKLGKGHVVFVPPVQGNAGEIGAYFRALVQLPSSLSLEKSEFPDWIDNYQSQRQTLASQQAFKLTQDAQKALESAAEQERVVAAERELKRLVCATDAEFASAVASALTELGFSVVNGPSSQADLLARLGEQVVAVEAKGLDGPAKMRDARQAAQWATEVDTALTLEEDPSNARRDLAGYVEQLAKLDLVPVENRIGDCKPLLIIGTFRNLPLHERTQPDFPDSMLGVLTRHGICALTGLQLLSMLLAVRDNPTLRDDLRKELLETRGVFEQFQNWEAFLTRTDGATSA